MEWEANEEGRRLRAEEAGKRRTKKGGRSPGPGKEDEHNGGHMPAGSSRQRRGIRRRRERGGCRPEREENNAMFLYHIRYTQAMLWPDRYTPGASSGM